jgi:hypothetical protein
VQRCFSYGRDYEPLSNAYPMAFPYLALVDDVIGGRCHNPAMACSRMTRPPARHPAWNCDSADPREHWTSQPELYCLNDMLWVIDHVDPRISYSDPATLGAAQGRDFSAGTLPATTTRLERR